jgi:alpha-amylase
LDFATPSDVVRREKVLEPLTYPRPISWADEERDLSAWLGNHMQRAAHEAIYALADAARSCGDPELLEAWRDLTTSDHVYYLSTKCASDGDVHQYFSPYDSPHDAFLTVMNVVEDLGRRLGVK